MLDGNEKRSVEESYAGAVGASSLKIEPHKFTSADLVAAAGMNQYRMGMALMRLVSEWNSGAVPKERSLPDLKELAKFMASERLKREIDNSPRMSLGKVDALRTANTVEKADMELAKAELRRLQAEATNWNIEESKLRFQRLKTLPTVRSALLFWVTDRGWEGAEQLVSSVLRYFLSPKCPACGGSGVREFAGNLRKGAGKPCRVCENNTVRGELNIPHGGRGRALLQYMKQCTGQAAYDLRAGAHKLRRSTKELEDRKMRQHHERIAELQRADVEAREDEKQDNAAVAAHFRNSMGRSRPKEQA